MNKHLPSWLRIKRTPKKVYLDKMKALLKDIEICSVCESAKCPNVGECFSQKKITFMILGDTCTRNCSFCGVSKGRGQIVDEAEPENISKAIKRLGLKYVVITSVTRDDLKDGGAGQFVKVINKLRKEDKDVIIEILVPDFKGDDKVLRKILECKPDVFNHNLETVSRLYHSVRQGADYDRSLNIIKLASDFQEEIVTKSGLMVGLGETMEELERTFFDLNRVGCQVVTIGQYLRPSKEEIEVVEYISPEKFDKIKELAESFNFKKVIAGSFVRSSYRAEEVFSK